MPKVFILEDDPERISYFKELLGHVADLTIISSCVEVDKFQPPYDLIFLDHDLGGRQMVDHEDCGLTFVKQADSFTPNDLIIVHSYNPVGAKQMLAELPVGAMYCPFRGVAFNNAVEMILKVWNNKK